MPEKIDEIINTIVTIKRGVGSFLEHQRVGDTGRYHHTYSGDFYEPDQNYGVESSTFALKLYYALGETKDNPAVIKAIENIKSFTQPNGYIYDPLINQKIMKSCWKANLKAFIKGGDWKELSNIRYKRAESRQGHSSMLLFGTLPEKFPNDIKVSSNEIIALLERFDWRYPWAAGSHMSHMMFYLNLAYQMGMISYNEFNKTRYEICKWVNAMQDNDSGSWHKGKTTNQEMINGAMKVITGFYAAGITEFEHSKELIDLCLGSVNDSQACDNFNIIYVLHKASLNCPEYRIDDIRRFAVERFGLYMQYYHPKEGGFSMEQGKAEDNYYGAHISYGYDEPDIHGTTMFIWGLSIIAKLLGIENEVGLYEFLT